MATKRKKRRRVSNSPARVTAPPEPCFTITLGPVPASAVLRTMDNLYENSELRQIKAQVDSAAPPSSRPRSKRSL